jgi:hypothetical protein
MRSLRIWAKDVGFVVYEVPDNATDAEDVALGHAALDEARRAKGDEPAK